MRDIKFRAWIPSIGLMIYNDDIDTISIDLNNATISTKERSRFDGAVFCIHIDFLMQYTGLIDYTGTDIYEGDIVPAKVTIQVDDDCEDFSYYNSHEDGSKTKHCCMPKPSEVVWTKNGYEFRHHTGKSQSFWIAGKSIEDYIVIGNIYQNPELLEGNDK
jgi:uncharacterized phage protein (TIGR01671 family)